MEILYSLLISIPFIIWGTLAVLSKRKWKVKTEKIIQELRDDIRELEERNRQLWRELKTEEQIGKRLEKEKNQKKEMYKKVFKISETKNIDNTFDNPLNPLNPISPLNAMNPLSPFYIVHDDDYDSKRSQHIDSPHLSHNSSPSSCSDSDSPSSSDSSGGDCGGGSD